MPGVVYVLTPQNAPKTYPLPTELFFQGEVVAIVAAETEDQAEDAVEAIQVEYEVLPFASSLRASHGAERAGPERSKPRKASVKTTLIEWGEVDKAFAAGGCRQGVYLLVFGGDSGSVAADRVRRQMGWRQADDLGHGAVYLSVASDHGQALGHSRRERSLHRQMERRDVWRSAMPPATSSMLGSPTSPKQTGRPVEIDASQESGAGVPASEAADAQQVQGGSDQGRENHWPASASSTSIRARIRGGVRRDGGGRSELYLHVVPNWREIGFLYRTNSIVTGSSRSNFQQEFKWAWEQMMDEMAEAVGMDPVQFRLLNVQKPGTKVALKQGGPTIIPMPETENGIPALRLLCFGGSAGRGRQGHRMGQEKSRARRKPGKVQARTRSGDVPAPRRPRGLPGRRARLRLGACRRVKRRQGAVNPAASGTSIQRGTGVEPRRPHRHALRPARQRYEPRHLDVHAGRRNSRVHDAGSHPLDLGRFGHSHRRRLAGTAA